MNGIEDQRDKHCKNQISGKIAGDNCNGYEYLHCVGKIFGYDPPNRGGKDRNALNKKSNRIQQCRDNGAVLEHGRINKANYNTRDSHCSANYFTAQLFLAAVCKIIA